MSENLFSVFRSRFPADLSKVFLERPDGSTLTYEDLISISGQLANALVGLGVKPGDRVAAQVEKSAEALLLYLGALRAGAVYLPLNSAYTTGEIRYFLGDAEPRVFVCRLRRPGHGRVRGCGPGSRIFSLISPPPGSGDLRPAFLSRLLSVMRNCGGLPLSAA